MGLIEALELALGKEVFTFLMNGEGKHKQLIEKKVMELRNK